MRILRGLEEAKNHIASRGNIESDAVPEAVAKGIEDIFGRAMSPAEVVTCILEEVRLRGDTAVKELSRRIDGVDYDDLEVDREDMERAYYSLPEELQDAMRTAAARIASFAEASLPKSWYDETTGLGETVSPLERVGVYVPGGTAAYPSTVLMTVVTARSAGVDEIIMCTPVKGDQSNVVLAAAYAAGVDRVFRVGGAQAIAAMAYGTESVPAVHKICGPGNIFVTLAKKLVFGAVGIDGIFGPTETMIIADEHADPRICAADLIGQAEHDIMASPAMATDSQALADEVTAEMERQMETLERREIIRGAVDGQGVIFIVDNLDQAVEVANLFAPEHLTLLVQDPWALKPKVRHAGALFLGRHSGEVLGDYIAGPSHTIPTHGTARFASYLGSDQFVKRFPVVSLNESDVDALTKPAAVLARAEGLTAHARAVELRREQRRPS